jgi:hypothetical protein
MAQMKDIFQSQSKLTLRPLAKFYEQNWQGASFASTGEIPGVNFTNI